MTDKELVHLASIAKENAYVPYSHFHVGAVLLCKDGSLFSGCNIENSSYGITMCAERTALFKAVSEGHTDDFEVLTVIGDSTDYCMPCGACRQAFSEFAPKLKVLIANKSEEYMTTSIDALLPGMFGAAHMDV